MLIRGPSTGEDSPDVMPVKSWGVGRVDGRVWNKPFTEICFVKFTTDSSRKTTVHLLLA